jgi:hypothetical protein
MVLTGALWGKGPSPGPESWALTGGEKPASGTQRKRTTMRSFTLPPYALRVQRLRKFVNREKKNQDY